ncbi:hypothetical protein HMN09_01160400 [Mycena chlorophos]|uniref:Uncharacterized protein n=1 Tax=Mycena chlorophos TaxID=658473 RepID=A0A8H6VUE3_MYCCL|nr:hypothetical protein HMN09_01160400 [Mycena chlorophos]
MVGAISVDFAVKPRFHPSFPPSAASLQSLKTLNVVAAPSNIPARTSSEVRFGVCSAGTGRWRWRWLDKHLRHSQLDVDGGLAVGSRRRAVPSIGCYRATPPSTRFATGSAWTCSRAKAVGQQNGERYEQVSKDILNSNSFKYLIDSISARCALAPGETFESQLERRLTASFLGLMDGVEWFGLICGGRVGGTEDGLVRLLRLGPAMRLQVETSYTVRGTGRDELGADLLPRISRRVLREGHGVDGRGTDAAAEDQQ